MQTRTTSGSRRTPKAIISPRITKKLHENSQGLVKLDRYLANKLSEKGSQHPIFAIKFKSYMERCQKLNRPLPSLGDEIIFHTFGGFSVVFVLATPKWAQHRITKPTKKQARCPLQLTTYMTCKARRGPMTVWSPTLNISAHR